MELIKRSNIIWMRHGSIYEVMNNFKDAKQGYSHADTHMAFGRLVWTNDELQKNLKN